MLTQHDIAVLRVLERHGMAAAQQFVREPDPINTNPMVHAHQIWRETCENFVNSSKRCWMAWLTLWTPSFPNLSPN